MPIPTLNKLEGFPQFPEVITLVSSGGKFKSNSMLSGVNVTSPVDGTVIMRFVLSAGMFDNGTLEQQTSQVVSADHDASIKMAWIFTTSDAALTTFKVTVFVSLQGDTGDEHLVMVLHVTQANAFKKMVAAIKKMFL